MIIKYKKFNMTIYQKLIDNPIETLKTLKVQEIVDILTEADEKFFNTNETLLPDDIYDIVKQHLRKRDSKNIYLKKVGHEITQNKEALPYYMGSLDKIKDNSNEITKWKNKYKENYIVSEKLDGISCLLLYDKGNFKLMTRGDGYNGQNITDILSYINLNTLKIKEIGDKVAIRGELIISRRNWEKIAHLGANARNVVSGVVHSKSINKNILSKIDFVAYDVMYPRQRINNTMSFLKHLDLKSVNHIYMTEEELNLETLSNILQKWRKESEYEIDGIVVYHNGDHKIINGKNPKYAFAFKTIMTQEQAEVIVTDVEWNISKHRLLKPIIKFNEISLGGVKIKQATGFNAGYIKENVIGVGSHVVIIRSGDVIPHIISVLKPALNGKPKLPEIPFKWNETKVDIELIGDEKNRDHEIKSFSHFMKTLDIDGVKIGMITKLYDNGYDNLKKIINISLEELKVIDGIGLKSGEKIIEAFKNIKKADCNKLLTASNIFKGFGEKKFKMITDVYPYIVYDKKKGMKLTVNDIINIKGIAEITANIFIENLPKFYEFCEDLQIKCQMEESTKEITKKFEIFKDKKVIFSGFRNKDYEEMIISSGGKIVTSVSKSSDYLIVKDKNEISTKVKQAQELGVKIMTKEELEKILLKS